MGRIYYGWVVVAATIIINGLVVGTTFLTFGMYVNPVSEEFGLSRAEINTGLVLLNLGNSLQAPFLGRLLDRGYVRHCMVAAALMFIASFALLSVSHSLLLCAIVLALLLPFAMEASGTLTGPLLLGRWFSARRAQAMVISQLGLSLGGLAMPLVIGALMQAYGWRTSLMIVGVAAGVALLLISVLLRLRPGPNDREPGADDPAAMERAAAAPRATLRIGQIIREPTVWSLAIGAMAVIALSQALLISAVPIGQHQGLTIIQAASLISVWSTCGLIAKLTLSFVVDRFNKALLLVVLFLLGAAANLFFSMSTGYVQLLIAAGFFGFIYTAVTPVYFAIVADRFGIASFGTVAGLAIPIGSVLSIISVRFAGEVFDRTGSYDIMFLTFIVVHLIAAALLYASRHNKVIAQEAIA